MPDDEPDVPAPALPDVERPPTEEVLDGVPSEADVIAAAASAEEIIGEQPSVDELLGRSRKDAEAG